MSRMYHEKYSSRLYHLGLFFLLLLASAKVTEIYMLKPIEKAELEFSANWEHFFSLSPELYIQGLNNLCFLIRDWET